MKTQLFNSYLNDAVSMEKSNRDFWQGTADCSTMTEIALITTYERMSGLVHLWHQQTFFFFQSNNAESKLAIFDLHSLLPSRVKVKTIF